MNILEAFEKMKQGKLCYYENEAGTVWVCGLTCRPDIEGREGKSVYVLIGRLRGGQWLNNFGLNAPEVLNEWFDYESEEKG